MLGSSQPVARGELRVNGRLEALFVISITLGPRPGELRTLTWDHEDLSKGVVHVWRSASKSGDTKTPKSKRSLELQKRAKCHDR
jgi:integrase